SGKSLGTNARNSEDACPSLVIKSRLDGIGAPHVGNAKLIDQSGAEGINVSEGDVVQVDGLALPETELGVVEKTQAILNGFAAELAIHIPRKAEKELVVGRQLLINL